MSGQTNKQTHKALYVYRCSYTLYKPAIDSVTSRTVYITRVMRSFWKIVEEIRGVVAYVAWWLNGRAPDS